MSTLTERLRAMAVFDEQETYAELSRQVGDKLMPTANIRYAGVDMARWQRARLQPLLERLIECVEAAEAMRNEADASKQLSKMFGGGSYVQLRVNYDRVHEALQRLEQLAEGE